MFWWKINRQKLRCPRIYEIPLNMLLLSYNLNLETSCSISFLDYPTIYDILQEQANEFETVLSAVYN